MAELRDDALAQLNVAMWGNRLMAELRIGSTEYGNAGECGNVGKQINGGIA